MKKKYKKIKKKMVQSERIAFELVLKGVDRDIEVLDVGCGQGAKLAMLEGLGFTRLTGVEINDNSVSKARAKGFAVFSPQEFEDKFADKKFGLVFLSHVIEHFCPRHLPTFLDQWLDKLGDQGLVVIATPLPGPDFYKDFDHFKPYFPEGVLDFYSRGEAQVANSSKAGLRLLDIRFRRSPFRLRLYRGLYLKKNDFVFHLVNIGLVWLYYASFGLIGRKDAWIGLFEKSL